MISDTSRRPDLDGLRAIAVLSVIFAHAGFSGLSGGWVGVDVFFVLSGYLITGILLRSFRDQTFSWRGFFARRLRRLAPAFLGVGVISIAVFSFLMPPRLFMPAMETLAWSAVGVGNFEMARQIDYFADDDSLNPFTHLWSLGIEEQFYLVFPALLLLAWKRRHAQALVLFLLALSLYALWISRDLPASYFLPWTRAWGLLMGAALAIHAQPGGRPFPAWTGWIGGALLAASILMGNGDGTHWQVYAVLAAVASLLIIGAREGSFAYLLSTPALVGIGVASYSMYLVHQPVVVVVKILNGAGDIGLLSMCAVVALAVFMGLALRRWIEEPFLTGSVRTLPRRLVAAHLFLCLFAIVMASSPVQPLRAEVVRASFGGGVMMEDRLRPNYGHPGGCADLPVEACPAITQNNVLWGDSHAMHLSDALQEMGFVHSQRTKSACAPLVGVSGFISEAHHYDLAWARSCAAFNRETFEELMAHEEPGVVFLSSSTWLSGYRHFLYDIDGSVKDEDWRTVLENSARTTFVPLLEKGWTVVFLGPGIGGTKNIGQCSAIAAWTGFVDRDACTFAFSNQKELVETEIDRITKELGFTFIPIHPWICPQGICNRAVEEDVYIWRDVSHLSHEGSRWLGRQQGFKEAIDKAMSSNISAHTLD